MGHQCTFLLHKPKTPRNCVNCEFSNGHGFKEEVGRPVWKCAISDTATYYDQLWEGCLDWKYNESTLTMLLDQLK